VGELLTLVRINVPSVYRDKEGRVVTHIDQDYVWDHVVRHHKKWQSDDVKILYMTRRDLQEDTSLVIDAKDPDCLADFLLEHIAPVKYVRGIWVIHLSKMRFFKIPLDRPGDFTRFTVKLDVLPQNMNAVFETLSSLKPGRDIMINYIAHSFQSLWASIILSVLARSRNHMETFVEECILTLDGVMDAEITHISKTLRLVSDEEWQKSVGPYFVTPTGEPIKDINPVYDDSLIAGC